MHTGGIRGNMKQWRESASVILVAKTAFGPTGVHKGNGNGQDCNYKLLTIKRAAKSSFMPGTYVFPGGALEAADATRDWLKLYERFGFPGQSFAQLDRKGNNVALFKTPDLDQIPRYLSLRIGAIRETFEECGILICRSHHLKYHERPARWAAFIGGPEIRKWQDRVHDDPCQFIEMCNTFEVYPDVWALKEWSNWATPTPSPVLFDTVFFLAAFHQLPLTQAEKKEVQHLEWCSPTDYLQRNEKESINLPPPQYYEMARLRNFRDIEKLAKFAQKRAVCGLERYLPVRYLCEDGVFTILPGDDLYEEHHQHVDKMREMPKLPDSNVQHRMHHMSMFSNRVINLNFQPKFEHVVPLPLPENNSKL